MLARAVEKRSQVAVVADVGRGVAADAGGVGRRKPRQCARRVMRAVVARGAANRQPPAGEKKRQLREASERSSIAASARAPQSNVCLQMRAGPARSTHVLRDTAARPPAKRVTVADTRCRLPEHAAEDAASRPRRHPRERYAYVARRVVTCVMLRASSRGAPPSASAAATARSAAAPRAHARVYGVARVIACRRVTAHAQAIRRCLFHRCRAVAPCARTGRIAR